MRLNGFVAFLDDSSPHEADYLSPTIDHWLIEMVPSNELRQWCVCAGAWYDFERRYQLELMPKRAACESLAEIARSQVLWLIGGISDVMQRAVVALKQHLELLEARRRYSAGWIIGGHALPVRDEILRLGGLWLPRHKAWTLPYRETWGQIQEMLPGDF